MRNLLLPLFLLSRHKFLNFLLPVFRWLQYFIIVKHILSLMSFSSSQEWSWGHHTLFFSCKRFLLQYPLSTYFLSCFSESLTPILSLSLASHCLLSLGFFSFLFFVSLSHHIWFGQRDVLTEGNDTFRGWTTCNFWRWNEKTTEKEMELFWSLLWTSSPSISFIIEYLSLSLFSLETKWETMSNRGIMSVWESSGDLRQNE